MADEQPAGLVPIGRFARCTGLSIGALRHYDSLGLLVPARTAPASGYRYYAPDQVEPARLIAALRDLEVPLEVIRELLHVPPAERRRRLSTHYAALEAESWRLQRRAHRLRQAIQNEEELMPTRPATALDPDDERRLAAALFNRVWDLLERPGRTPADDDTMLHAVHASRYHWGQVGQPVNLARGEWQCSRVYAVLGRPEPALHHARRCLELAETHQLSPFDVACGHEALARAHRLADETDAATHHLKQATALTELIHDPEERQVLLGDLAQLG